jgi:hypothetical protein
MDVHTETIAPALNVNNDASNNDLSYSDKNVKCLLFNARSICNKFDEFHVMLRTIQPSIVAITETWLNDNTDCNNFLDPDNLFSVFKHNRALSRGGVFVY